MAKPPPLERNPVPLRWEGLMFIWLAWFVAFGLVMWAVLS